MKASSIHLANQRNRCCSRSAPRIPRRCLYPCPAVPPPTSGHLSPSTFLIEKVDASNGDPLSGVTFRLQDGKGHTATGTTGPLGIATFQLLANSTYSIVEIIPSAGYLPNPIDYQITIDSRGLIYVNGLQTNKLRIENTPVGDGQIIVNYLLQPRLTELFPSITISQPPGPYTVPDPAVEILPYSNECSALYIHLVGSTGVPTSGTISANETLVVNFVYAVAACPETTIFDPNLLQCVIGSCD